PAGAGAATAGPRRLAAARPARRRGDRRPAAVDGAALHLPAARGPGSRGGTGAPGRLRLRPGRLPHALAGLAARQLGGPAAGRALRPRALRRPWRPARPPAACPLDRLPAARRTPRDGRLRGRLRVALPACPLAAAAGAAGGRAPPAARGDPAGAVCRL